MTESRSIVRSESQGADSLADLFDELTARLQAGRGIDWSEVARTHPAHADELRRLLPAVRLLADLSRSGADPAAGPDPAALGELGDFRLVREVGRGGMGVVYEAEQVSLRRRVALKVLPFAAALDPRHLQRFKNEALAAASLKHDHVVQVYAVGCERGVHFIAMEFVDGRTVADLIRDLRPDAETETTRDYRPGEPDAPTRPAAGLSTRDARPKGRDHYRRAAELVAQAADALEYAHSFGIVHRDVKPANLLLDAAGRVSVADFGLARVGPDAGMTGTGDLLGTLRYMAPEQALAKHNLVDHRADVYGLGAVLYELLTLHPVVGPGDRAEVLRKVMFEEPTAPRKLDRAVPPELETVCLKCLAKDPADRYATAGELAADLRRFLAGEPVRATRPTALSRLRKFVRRNRRPVAAGVALASLLVLGIAGTSVGLVRALRAERAATQEADRATAAEAEAREEAAVATAVNEFLLGDLLAQAAPAENARDRKVTVEDLLGRAAARIGGKFAGQPRVEAEIRLTIGSTYKALGEYPAAQPHLERAWEIGRSVLGEEHPRTLVAMNNLALLYEAQGRLAEAEPLLARGLEVSRRVLGEGHPGTLAAMNNLAILHNARGRLAEAEPLLVETLEVTRRVLGEEYPDTLSAMGNLALLYQAQGRLAEAEPLFARALQIKRRVQGEEHPGTLTAMSNLAELHRARGRFAEAEPLARKALEVSGRVLGVEHPDTIKSANNLALVYLARGRLAEAEPLFARVLEERRRVLGEEHPETLHAMNNLAVLYQKQDRLAEAEPLLDKALQIKRRVLGEEHPHIPGAMGNLAMLYKDQGRLAEAEPLFARALELCARVRGEEHPETLTSMNNLASVYQARGRFAEAEPLALKALEVSGRVLGEGHPETLAFMSNLASMYRAEGDLPKAEPLLVKAVEGRRRVLGEEHPGTLQSMNNLATLYQAQGQFRKAEPLYREALRTAGKLYGEASLPASGAQAILGLNLLRQQRYADAAPLLRECLRIREQQVPDNWTTFNTKSLLGGSLLGQKKYAEAEPLLLAGYEGMKQREETIPPPGKVRLTEAVERLVQLYEATGQKDQAAAWREKLPVGKAAKPAETRKD